MMRTSTLVKGVLAAAALLPLLAHAESNVQNGSGTLNATAHVDFTVTIPQMLYLRVGTGSTYTTGAYTADTTVDNIQFAPAAGTVGNGTAVAGTGGDLTGGVETAAVIGNGGTITLNATAGGALQDAGGDTINYTQITTTAGSNTTGTVLAAPTLANGASNTITLTPALHSTIFQDAKWTYQYANTVTPPAGTYGGVNTNNGRVVYTASMHGSFQGPASCPPAGAPRNSAAGGVTCR
jgi:hypothetical protein